MVPFDTCHLLTLDENMSQVSSSSKRSTSIAPLNARQSTVSPANVPPPYPPAIALPDGFVALLASPGRAIDGYADATPRVFLCSCFRADCCRGVLAGHIRPRLHWSDQT
eukprot:750568-Hanusia_phi.AAC.5